MSKYGEQETNPLEGKTRDFVMEAVEYVDWTDPNLKRVVRLRLLSDPGFPMWDVSYCVGEMKDGKAVHVQLPFDQLPKKGMRGMIVKWAKQDKVFAQGLGIFDAISTLI